ncbi:malonate transporter, putative [Oceanicola granulosus HTCC2516]|uniref:Malonate transporter, putative n=1 Tax=Oceanicola granulosus (strain ATCC BAA-861 / DSM 15982 / KCTC 12143 / HTCC2516) TaxID=314256 RepID=Q2CCB5_OCEGH|nr:AEC family transporter [Oceanicola granulosus]EAR50318.1 malonate transporter, putative [Oceanicola granulosus HTCC2516]
MGALVNVILPVFIVIGFGYLARWRSLLDDGQVDGLMRFTQNFAIPCLLFNAISSLDLAASYDWRLLVSFYAGAIAGFVAGLVGGRVLFGRAWEDSVAFGFSGLFSNLVLLGLPIMERAYGPDALMNNFVIISMHAPFCYGIGVTAMEIIRSRGEPARTLPLKVLKAMFSNALILGIALGFAVNVTNFPMPTVLSEALDLMVRAALPVALFGLGGVLVRYKPQGDMRAILFVSSLSLVLHPVITYGLGTAFALERDALRSAVICAAMAPGVNTYVFANMYGVAKRVSASVVLMATGLSILTIWGWLAVLP